MQPGLHTYTHGNAFVCFQDQSVMCIGEKEYVLEGKKDSSRGNCCFWFEAEW